MKHSKHLQKVREIIEGYETPYGLELLSTIHAVIHSKPEIKNNLQSVIEEVHNWNERKRKIFKEKHIKVALKHLNNVTV